MRKKGFTTERKTRSDAGSSVFNCEKKRKQSFTAFNIYKKRRYNEFRENPGHIRENELKNAFSNLPLDEKQALEVLAERDITRARTSCKR